MANTEENIRMEERNMVLFGFSRAEVLKYNEID